MASRTAAKIQWHISVKSLILNNTTIFFSIILSFFEFNSCLACYIPFRLPGVMVRQPPPFSFPFGTEPLTSRSHPAFLFPSRRCPRRPPLSEEKEDSLSLPPRLPLSLPLSVVFVVLSLLHLASPAESSLGTLGYSFLSWCLCPVLVLFCLLHCMFQN